MDLGLVYLMVYFFCSSISTLEIPLLNIFSCVWKIILMIEPLSYWYAKRAVLFNLNNTAAP